MLVNIDNSRAVDMLLERLKYWTDDYTTYKLYESMYRNYVDGGCFDGGDFDIMVIVDNDYINHFAVVSEGDEAYEDIKKLYYTEGLTDVSCKKALNHGYKFIEAEYDGNFLLRK